MHICTFNWRKRLAGNRVILTFLILLIFSKSNVRAKDYSIYLFDAQSLYGGTGQITLPSTQVVKVNKYSWGIHQFNIAASYGIIPNCEIGVFFDLNKMGQINSTLDLWNWLKSEQVMFQTKYQLLSQGIYPIDLAAGIRGSEIYLAGSKKIVYSLIPELGIFLRKENNEMKLGPFFSVSKVMPYSAFLFDYDYIRNECSLGWRFLLSPKIKFDFFLINIGLMKNLLFDNFVFGLTLSG